MTDKRIVLTTCGSLEEARTIASALVERQLAACVNIIPHVESVYRWKDQVETGSEWLLLIKTKEDAVKPMEAALRKLHSYELPECISISIEDGSEPYLNWIEASVK